MQQVGSKQFEIQEWLLYTTGFAVSVCYEKQESTYFFILRGKGTGKLIYSKPVLVAGQTRWINGLFYFVSLHLRQNVGMFQCFAMLCSSCWRLLKKIEAYLCFIHKRKQTSLESSAIWIVYVGSVRQSKLKTGHFLFLSTPCHNK